MACSSSAYVLCQWAGLSVGHLDFLGVNNSFSEETLSGYYDAGIGVCALGRGDGTFEILPPNKSGFCVRTDAKAIAEIKIDGKRRWIIGSNKAPLMMFGDSPDTDKKKPSDLLSSYITSQRIAISRKDKKNN